MRVLLVVPDSVGINAMPEIDLITSMHRVRLLQGSVTKQRLFNDVRENQYNIIHFATHSNEIGVQLEDGFLTPEELSQIIRLSSADMVFFNSCESGKLADYAVRHGLKYAIHTNTDLEDAVAWQMPLAFYRFLKDQKESSLPIDYTEAFMFADTGEGIYGLSVSYDILRQGSLILDKIQIEQVRHSNVLSKLQRRNTWLLVSQIVSYLLMFFILGMLITG